MRSRFAARRMQPFFWKACEGRGCRRVERFSLGDIMNVARREFLLFAGAALATTVASRLSWTTTSWAQTWPARPIRAIVPFVASTGIDIVARLVMNELSTQLGQPIVIENRPGASATLGAAVVAKASADG